MTGRITEFVGIYDADSSLWGEVSYWVGARLGRTHCSLCEITHGLFTEKPDWRRCRDALSVPVRTYHRDDAPPDVLDAADGRFPIVLARSESHLEVALNPAQLESLEGSVERFAEALEAIVVRD